MRPLFLSLCFIFIAMNSAYARVVNGFPATAEEAPWVVKIELNKVHHCTGSLIASKWVLTAAHCLFNFDKSKMVILGGGSAKVGGLESLPKIKNTFIRPGYASFTQAPNKDIALIELEARIQESETLKPISLLNSEELSEIRNEEVFSFFGWGRTTKSSEFPKQFLTFQHTLLDLNNRKLLRELELSLYKKDGFLITYAEKTSCSGDSGGGMVVEHRGETRLAGVLIQGNCRTISISNPVGNHLEWINGIASPTK